MHTFPYNFSLEKCELHASLLKVPLCLVINNRTGNYMADNQNIRSKVADKSVWGMVSVQTRRYR